MRRGREREREKKSSWGWNGLQSSEGRQLLTTMIPVYMYPQKKEKPTRYWSQHTQLDQSKSNRERERRWEGGVVLLL